VVTKSMTWSEMQKKLPEDKAFYELSFGEIMQVFGLDEQYAQGNQKAEITEENDKITVSLHP
jgi:hypothetical protein